MQKVVISQNEYRKLLEGQRELRARVNALQKIIEDELGEEIRPEVLRRVEKRSRAMDKGVGIRLKSGREIKEFFRSL